MSVPTDVDPSIIRCVPSHRRDSCLLPGVVLYVMVIGFKVGKRASEVARRAGRPLCPSTRVRWLREARWGARAAAARENREECVLQTRPQDLEKRHADTIFTVYSIRTGDDTLFTGESVNTPRTADTDHSGDSHTAGREGRLQIDHYSDRVFCSVKRSKRHGPDKFETSASTHAAVRQLCVARRRLDISVARANDRDSGD